MQLIANWFSPFARKVALALDFKGIDYVAIDGLAQTNHELLWQVNPRGEVPTLIDEDLVLANSASIMAYLEDAFPQPSLLPGEAKSRARARALERLYDTRVDAILVNCSLWQWSNREDQPRPGLLAAGQRDLEAALAQTEQLLGEKGRFAFGDEPGLADFAMWPHLAAIEPLGFAFDQTRFARTAALLKSMRDTPLFRSDATRTREFLQSMTAQTHQTTRIAWRGDRLERMMARGFHKWLVSEIQADRVIWPIR